ncbi:MAG: hypothetical protein KDA86_02055 [Planctomycetaceae bacterium]|nr:hypothetical protein [Planctomycetaceae bacterium]
MSHRETDIDEKVERRRMVSISLLVVLVLGFYPLSIGPFTYLRFRDDISRKTYDTGLNTVYLPLKPWWIDDARADPNLLGRTAFQHYIYLWEMLGAEPDHQ